MAASGGTCGRLRRTLLARQNPDGGFPPAARLPSGTEATAITLLALGSGPASGLSPALERAERWLLSHQRGDGAWPVAEGVAEAFWATPLAILALAGNRTPQARERVQKGLLWLLAAEGRRPGPLATLVQRLLPAHRSSSIDVRVRGWPWHPEAFSWVEPTSLALLALKKLAAPLPSAKTALRIAEGEGLLFDRMCVAGGWNYGNSVVLGEPLAPYPDVTAIALLALQDRGSDPRVRTSLDALDEMLHRAPSHLSLSLGILSFRLHGRQPKGWDGRLERRLGADLADVETRTLALAFLALVGGQEVFAL